MRFKLEFDRIKRATQLSDIGGSLAQLDFEQRTQRQELLEVMVYHLQKVVRKLVERGDELGYDPLVIQDICNWEPVWEHDPWIGWYVTDARVVGRSGENPVFHDIY